MNNGLSHLVWHDGGIIVVVPCTGKGCAICANDLRDREDVENPPRVREPTTNNTYKAGYAAALRDVAHFVEAEKNQNDLSTERLIGAAAQWDRIRRFIIAHMPTLALLLLLGGLPCLTACTTQIESSSEVGGVGGSGGGASSEGGSRGTSGGSGPASNSASTSAATSSDASSASASTGGGSSDGGGPDCITCAQALDFATGDICDASAHYAAELEACDRGFCADLCGATDDPKSPNASPDCAACLKDSCASELADCGAH